MSIFEKQVQFNDCDAGPEPSLRQIIALYYMEHFNDKEALRLTDKLIDALSFELVVDDNQLLMDAQRYRWLCEDHPDADDRRRRNDLLEYFRVRSYSANSTAIDAAISLGEKA